MENISSNYNICKKLALGTVILSVFENPVNVRKPYRVITIVSEEKETIRIESPVVDGLKKETLYEIKIKLYKSEKERVLFGEHIQKIAFQ